MGTASGVTLGLTVSIGSIACPLIGTLADATSLQVALIPLIVLPGIGWLFLRTLHDPTLDPSEPTRRVVEPGVDDSNVARSIR